MPCTKTKRHLAFHWNYIMGTELLNRATQTAVWNKFCWARSFFLFRLHIIIHISIYNVNNSCLPLRIPGWTERRETEKCVYWPSCHRFLCRAVLLSTTGQSASSTVILLNRIQSRIGFNQSGAEWLENLQWAMLNWKRISILISARHWYRCANENRSHLIHLNVEIQHLLDDFKCSVLQSFHAMLCDRCHTCSVDISHKMCGQ